MAIPTPLTDELKLYLKQQADKGDLEAQTLLSQIEQTTPSLTITSEDEQDVEDSDNPELGC